MSHFDNLTRLIDANPELKKILTEDSTLLLTIFAAVDDADRYLALLGQFGNVTDAIAHAHLAMCKAFRDSAKAGWVSFVQNPPTEGEAPVTSEKKQGYVH